MKIIIIGSKGFIGSHCVTYFAEQNELWQCDIVADTSTPNYFLLDANRPDYDAIFKEEQFDVCINCSGAASDSDSITNPVGDYSLNVTGVMNQLAAIKKFNPNCKYINLSSAAVYGNPSHLPISESHPLQPISPYGEHKKEAEEWCHAFYVNYGIKTCSLRIFSAYGPGLKKQLFWDLYQKSLKSNEVQLYGTGAESRDFIYVTDIVRAIECVILKGTFISEIVNVANGIELSIKEVAQTFYNFYNKEIEASFGGETRKGDPVNWVADISKLKAYGFESKVNINDGLKQYVRWLNAGE